MDISVTGLKLPTPANKPSNEEPAFKERNSDGTVNYGSYRVLAGISAVEAAHDILHTQNPDQAPPLGQVQYLARLIMFACDYTQAILRPDRTVDRMAGSHTRARGAVRSAMEIFPIPVGGTDEDRSTWLQAVIDRAVSLCQMGASLSYEEFPIDTPANIEEPEDTTEPDTPAVAS